MTPKPRSTPTASKRKPTFIPFTDENGHTLRLSGSMRLQELLKLGRIEIHIQHPASSH